MAHPGSLVRHHWPLRRGSPVPRTRAAEGMPASGRLAGLLTRQRLAGLGLLLVLAGAVPPLLALGAVREMRARPSPGAPSAEAAASQLDRQLARRAARHLDGEAPPFLRAMAGQLAATLADAGAQGRLLAALHCGGDAPPLLGSLAGMGWAGGGIEVVLAPCLGGEDGVRVTIAPGGPLGLSLRLVDASLVPPGAAER